VSGARRKPSVSPPDLIETVRGVGYRFRETNPDAK
jgi:DNA-binding response OmpR family regulator